MPINDGLGPNNRRYEERGNGAKWAIVAVTAIAALGGLTWAMSDNNRGTQNATDTRPAASSTSTTGSGASTTPAAPRTGQ